MSTTTLIVARHGTVFGPGDVPLRVGSKSDMKLAPQGRAQAGALARYLKEMQLAPSQIFTSELTCAVQTAKRVQKELPGEAGSKIPLEKLAIFNEIDYGVDEGKPETEMVARFGEAALKAWDDETLPPLGWHVDSVGLRAAWYDFGQRIIKDFPGQTVLVVTHDGTARFASVLTGDANALQAANGVALNPGSFGHFVYEGPSWQCAGWNTPPLPTAKPRKTGVKAAGLRDTV